MRACAASLLRHAGDALWDGGSCHRVLLAAGQSLAAARLTGPAVAWWREVAARSERLLGPDHPDTLVAAGQLADALLAAGQHADAVQLRAVGRGRPGPRARPRPPGCYRRQDQPRPGAGRPPANVPRHSTSCGDAAARSERAYGHGDPEALAVLDEYAAAFLTAGDTATAVRFCKRSLAGREQAARPG